MEGDFALDPLALHGFSRILMQQGRVLLPSDWNEQVAIAAEQVRLLARDLIGAHGGVDDAFKITTDLLIQPGRYWVDGIPVQHQNVKGYPFADQPYYRPDGNPSGPAILYLDVFEVHVSAAEDPSILEVALGGVDTTSRARVIWQVRPWPLKQPATKAQLKSVTEEVIRSLSPNNLATLTAVARRDEDENDACIVAPDARYFGMENQLYRVEIHSAPAPGVEGPVKFKWSRDNGSIAIPLEKIEGATATVRAMGRDARTSLAGQNYVEVVDDSVVHNGPRQGLLRVKKVLPGTMTVELESPSTLPTDAKKHAVLRRWDSDLIDVPQGGGPRPLEKGIVVSFSKPGETVYRPGDYWLIPARTATGDVIWPRVDPDDPNSDPVPRPPDGPVHHYAPLAYWAGSGDPVDLRKTIKPATES